MKISASVAAISLQFFAFRFLPFILPSSASAFLADGPTFARPRAQSSRMASLAATADPVSQSPPPPVSVGFLGFGTIAYAICQGFLTASPAPQASAATVSRRSESNSGRITTDFAQASVGETNQAILDSSDVVFLCVLPQQTDEILKALEFDTGRHILVSLVGTATLTQLIAGSGLPADKVFKLNCLPAVAKHNGTCLLTPPAGSHTSLAALLGTLGTLVECESESRFQAMMVPSALMGPFYGILKQNRDWLVQQGAPLDEATAMVLGLYKNMINDAATKVKTGASFEELIEEQTPGGLNEQALRNLEAQGALGCYEGAMDAVLDRIQGKSDGSLRSPLNK